MISFKNKRVCARLGLEHWAAQTEKDLSAGAAVFIDTPSGGFVMSISKVACTSLRAAWLKHNEPLTYDNTPKTALHASISALAKSRHHSDKSQVYALLRDPVERIVSAYAMYTKRPMGQVPFGMGFNEFLVWVSQQDPWRTDPHTQSQLFGSIAGEKRFPLTSEGIQAFNEATGFLLPHENKATADKLTPSKAQRGFIEKLYTADIKAYKRLI